MVLPSFSLYGKGGAELLWEPITRWPNSRRKHCELRNNSICWTHPIGQPSLNVLQYFSTSSPQHLTNLTSSVSGSWIQSLPYCSSLEQSLSWQLNTVQCNFHFNSLNQNPTLKMSRAYSHFYQLSTTISGKYKYFRAANILQKSISLT